MATLNLRERLLETKIAYVGAALAGKSTNFDHLRGAQGAARTGAVHHDAGIASFEWRPLHFGKFDDCELSVQLRTPHDDGAQMVSPMRVDDAILEDVDGIVLVVDSQPNALEANRAAAATLRHNLEGRTVPVVVQLNKRDLPDALSEDALLSALEISTWPFVAACAFRGDGVMETVRRTIEGILATMQHAPAETVAREANPLLQALRGVLEDAIEARFRALEERMHERLSESVTGRRAEIDELRSEIASLRRDVAAKLEGVETRVIQAIDTRDELNRRKKSWFG